MNADPAQLPTDPEDQLASWLAELDDALRHGTDTTRFMDAPGAKASRPRLLGDLECLDLLHKHWPTPRPPFGAAASAAVSSACPALPLPLGKISRFEIVRELGHGGSGVVFLARDPLLRRDVALKVPRVNVLASQSLRARFEDESRAAALLDHPNIAPVYETGQAGPVTYIASAYCPGETLAQRIADAKEPAPERHAAALLLALADAVHRAHSRGVLHRDLKPGNVILVAGAGDAPGGPDVTPRITDFGLAKVLADADVAQTYSGAVIGTPAYMSPEQAAGDVAAITTASDIYGLGAILYDLLTGRPPFAGDSALVTMRRVESEEPERPSKWRRGLSADLETICLKCLRKDPRDRYATAAAVAADLRRFLAGQCVEARPAGAPERLRRWCGRNRLTAALLAALAAALLVLVVGAPLAALALRRQRDAERSARAEAVDRLWDANLARAQAARRLPRPGRRFDSLAAIEQAARVRPSLELRNEATACFPLADARLLRRWEAAPEGWTFLCADTGLHHYALVDAAGNVGVRSVSDGQEVARLPPLGPRPERGTFDRGGGLLALRSPGDAVRVWDWRHARELAKVKMPPGPTASFQQAFSRDGAVLWAALDDGTIRGVRVRGGDELPPLRFAAVPAEFALSPDERVLAVILWNHREILLVDPDTGATSRTLAAGAGAGPAHGLSWSDDGRLLASGNGDSRVYVWDVQSKDPRTTLAGHENVVMGAAFHPGGELLVSTGWDRHVRVWDVAAGRQVLDLEGEWPVLAADGARILLPKGRDAELWELSPGAGYRMTRAPEARGIGPLSVEVDPTGRWVATDGDDGARVWDLASGRQLLHLPVGRTRLAAFAPDGRHLLTSSDKGLLRWELVGEPPGGARLAAQIAPPGLDAEASVSGDGGRFAVVRSSAHAEVLEAGGPGAPVRLGPHHNIASATISPDGRWVATCTQHGSGIKLWDARGGALVADLPAGGYSRDFSPDGRSLLTASEGRPTELWDTATWRPRLTVKGSGMTISPDGRYLATVVGNCVTLMATATGEELVTLEPPHPLPISSASFTPDGRRLVVGSFSTQVVHALQVWDLTLIRRRLAGAGLDWTPSSPPALTR